MPRGSFVPTDDDIANAFLGENPLALLLGMMLDQQIPMERAFSAPSLLKERLGRLDAVFIASIPDSRLVEAFSRAPALHRFPKAMALRFKELCRIIVDQYQGDASHIWKTKTAEEALKNLSSLPGFSTEKAKIFLALLGKRFKEAPKGWESVAMPYSQKGVYMSVADIDSLKARELVRSFKRSLKSKKAG